MPSKLEAARHRLAPMLEPRSIAVVGASQREGSFGLRLAQAVLSAGYKGQIDFVNPRQINYFSWPLYILHIACVTRLM